MARILVVDDDEMTRELHSEILTLAGHQVITAQNGASALRQMDETIDLIIADLTMPQMDGYELVSQLRKAGTSASTPVIVISGLATGEWSVRLGATRFLPKPIQANQLAAVVTEILSGRDQ